jgi:superfamily II RNA helicase
MKIHISPKMIALMVQNAKTSEEIQAVHDLVKESAHPYQLGWILEQKIKKIREEQQESNVLIPRHLLESFEDFKTDAISTSLNNKLANDTLTTAQKWKKEQETKNND